MRIFLCVATFVIKHVFTQFRNTVEDPIFASSDVDLDIFAQSISNIVNIKVPDQIFLEENVSNNLSEYDIADIVHIKAPDLSIFDTPTKTRSSTTRSTSLTSSTVVSTLPTISLSTTRRSSAFIDSIVNIKVIDLDDQIKEKVKAIETVDISNLVDIKVGDFKQFEKETIDLDTTTTKTTTTTTATSTTTTTTTAATTRTIATTTNNKQQQQQQQQ